jgi:very-short-patch-repair endonuclease
MATGNDDGTICRTDLAPIAAACAAFRSTMKEGPVPSGSHYDDARRQHGIVTRDQLHEAGLTNKLIDARCREGELTPVTSGLYRLSGAPTTWHQRIWATLLAAQPGSVVSHRTAARLHNIGSFTTAEIDIVQPGNPIRVLTDGAAHRSLDLPESHWTLVECLPVTTIERTIFDLAGQVSAKRRRRGLPYLPRQMVERAFDDAIVRGMSHRRVQAVLDDIGGRGRGGTVLIRELLERRGDGYVATDSELEDLVERVLSDFGLLPLPTRQRNLGGLGDRTGRVDFVFRDFQVVLEADSRKHHTALMDQEHDRWRDLELTASGFIVVRATYIQLKTDPARFVQQLRMVLERRGWRPPTIAA